VTATARYLASPFGRTALAGILALAALGSLALSQYSVNGGLIGHYGVVASPAAITGELA
jgi:hypothetical protein